MTPSVTFTSIARTAAAVGTALLGQGLTALAETAEKRDPATPATSTPNEWGPTRFIVIDPTRFIVIAGMAGYAIVRGPDMARDFIGRVRRLPDQIPANARLLWNELTGNNQ